LHGEHGYASTVDDVADQADVRKTTIYRRWPTKRDLARAAVGSVAANVMVDANTGSLEQDLCVTLRSLRELLRTSRGQGLLRAAFAEGLDAEVSELARSVRDEHKAGPYAMISRAVARGELPRGTDPELVMETLIAALQNFLLLLHQPCDDAFIERLVKLVLYGAAGRPPPRRVPKR